MVCDVRLDSGARALTNSVKCAPVEEVEGGLRHAASQAHRQPIGLRCNERRFQRGPSKKVATSVPMSQQQKPRSWRKGVTWDSSKHEDH